MNNYPFSEFVLDSNWTNNDVTSYEQTHKQIWNDKEYTRHGVDIKAGDTVVDLGASIGTFSIFAACKGATNIICMEANTNTFEYLQKNIEKALTQDYLKNVNFQTIQGFVYGKERSARTIANYDLSFPGASHLISNKKDDYFYNMKDIFERFKLQKIDLLKLDVEGKEHDFFIEASEEYLTKINMICAEFHIHSILQNKMDDFANFLWIMSKLTHAGFKLKVDRIHKNTNLYMLYAINEKI